MECGSCTLCCEYLKIKTLDKPANVKCDHCTTNCTIYEERPLECSLFNCSYLQMENVSEKFRPDNCGIIFEKPKDNIFFGTHKGELSLDAKKQIVSFINQDFEVFTKDILGAVVIEHRKP